MSLCTAAHPLRTRNANIFGALFLKRQCDRTLDRGERADCRARQAAAAGPSGPAEGQKRDGNGIAWRRDRLQLLSMDEFALPSDSPFKRTCVVARLLDRASGCELSLLSAHFDHAGGDELGRGSAARRASAALVMARARAELERGGGGDARAVLVTGDCTPPRALNPRLSI